MTSDLDADQPRIGPTTWMRWRLLWRIHYGAPAAIALILWAIAIPLAITVVSRHTAQRAGVVDHEPDTLTARSVATQGTGQSASGTRPPSASPAASGPLASTALATALAAGDALLIQALPTTAQRGADLGALVAAARNAGLVPAQADYALETGAISGLARLRIDLPVRGSDSQLARFMTMLDAQLPNAVVESLVMTTTGPRPSLRINAHLHLVLYYRAPT
ncbi:MAG: hypothetical protein RL375_156 [Pseudomonadota bacterium]|jgi:hypothetical protein